MKNKKLQVLKSVKSVAPQKTSPTHSKSHGGTGSAKSAALKDPATIGGTSLGKSMIPRTRVSAIQCLQCGDTIYSCAVHDFHFCSCGAVFIDGGFEYCRIGGALDKIERKVKLIPATKKQLYDDWNQNGERKYGCIKLKSSWKSPLSQSSSVCLDSTITSSVTPLNNKSEASKLQDSSSQKNQKESKRPSSQPTRTLKSGGRMSSIIGLVLSMISLRSVV